MAQEIEVTLITFPQRDDWNKFQYNEEEYLVFSWNDEIIHEYFTICCSAPTIAEAVM